MHSFKSKIVIIVFSILVLQSFLSYTLPYQNKKLKVYNVPRDKYVIKVSYFESNLTIIGNLTLRHYNQYDITFNKLYFHIYPNAFISHGGYIRIFEVYGNGSNLKYRIIGKDKTILEVFLSKPLRPCNCIVIAIRFMVKVPILQDRFGYYKGILALGNWYPILAVYDELGWHLDPYCSYGESFNFYFSDYDVYFNVEKGTVVACTGVLVNKTIIEDREIYHWRAYRVREVAIAASKYYVISQTKLWNITIYSYYLPSNARAGKFALKVAYNALKVYSEHFGRYPYPVFRVCETYGWFGGMEYPMLVFITSRLYNSRILTSLEIVVAHETAHQWWYVTVGNDEANEPWLDEAFAEYSQVLYCEWVHGRSYAIRIFDSWIRRPYIRYISKHNDAPVALSVWNYTSPTQYYVMVYEKGAYVLNMLRFMLGDEKFFELLHKWYIYGKFKLVKIIDFIRLASEVYGKNLTWFFNQWLYSSGYPQFKIINAKAMPLDNGYLVTLEIVQEKPIRNFPMYIPLMIVGSKNNKIVKVFVNGTCKVTIRINFMPNYVCIDNHIVIANLDTESYTPIEIKPSKESLSQLAPNFLIITMYIILSFVSLKVLQRLRKGKK